jgi:hypothetical protein
MLYTNKHYTNINITQSRGGYEQSDGNGCYMPDKDWKEQKQTISFIQPQEAGQAPLQSQGRKVVAAHALGGAGKH